MSMTLQGLIRGLQEQKRGEYTFNYLCVEGENFDIKRIQLGREQETAEFKKAIQSLTGKVANVPFYIREFSGANGKGFGLNYNGNALPQPV